MRVKSVNEHEQPVGKFVFMRLTRSESVHAIGGSAGDHWQPSQVTHLLLSNVGSVSLIEPSQWNKADVLVAPSMGIGRGSEIQYRIYAKGYEVWRRQGDRTPVAQVGEENPATLTFTLAREDDSLASLAAPAAAALPGTEMMAADNSLGAASGAAEIISDLRDDNLWSQIETMWETAGNRRSIRFVCEYYQERTAAIERANPKWQLPTDIRDRLTWMRKLVAASV